MTNSAAPGGVHSSCLGGVAPTGCGAKPMARVSCCVPYSGDAGGTHEHTLADTPQGDRTERRWDAAYQFLLHWALDHDADSCPGPSHQQEASHGSSPVCPCLDHPATTNTDD